MVPPFASQPGRPASRAVVRSWLTETTPLTRDIPWCFLSYASPVAAMPPPLLLLQDIIVTFGVTPLLSGAELAVAAGDRV